MLNQESNDMDSNLFTDITIDEFVIFILRKKNMSEVISCKMLEKALQEKITNIEELRQMFTVYFKSEEESKQVSIEEDRTTTTTSSSKSNEERLEIWAEIVMGCIQKVVNQIITSDQLDKI